MSGEWLLQEFEKDRFDLFLDGYIVSYDLSEIEAEEIIQSRGINQYTFEALDGYRSLRFF